MQIFYSITLLLFTLSPCFPLVLLYHCNFDAEISDECVFDRTPGAPALMRTTGLVSDETPIPQLSDDTSIRTYAFVKTPNAAAFDHTYSTQVNNGENRMQCLDFYYYITDNPYNTKISVAWDADSTRQPIIELKATSDNKWQRCQQSFNRPSSSTYRISFELMRDDEPVNIYYALDEINIFDGPCESSSSGYNAGDKVASNAIKTDQLFDALDENDVTMDNTTLADNATVSTSLAGNATISTTLGGNATVSTSLADNATISTTLEGNATVSTTLAGNATVSTTLAGNATTSATLAGNATTSTTLAGNATTSTTLAGNATVSTTLASNATTSTILAGNATTSTTLAGNATTSTTLASNATSTITPAVNTTISTTSSSTTTATLPPLVTLLSCDFSNDTCITEGSQYVNITSGSEFAEAIALNTTEPPRGPVSAASAIPKSTNSNETCRLPYNISIFTNTSANWEMWFCYNNQCPNTDYKLLNCSSGTYGLISIASGEVSKSISMPIKPSSQSRAVTHKQCLHYYYYITFYNDISDRDQKIQVYIATGNSTLNQTLVDTVTTANMKNNTWQFNTVQLNLTAENYTLLFRFEVNTSNSTNLALNKAINFALDDIKLYDSDCFPVTEPINNGTTTTTTTTTTSLTSATPDASTSSPGKKNLGLILGLSLGLGIPILLGIIAGIVYYLKRNNDEDTFLTQPAYKKTKTYSSNEYDDVDDIKVSTTMF